MYSPFLTSLVSSYGYFAFLLCSGISVVLPGSMTTGQADDHTVGHLIPYNTVTLPGGA